MQKYKNMQKYTKITLGTSINFCSPRPANLIPIWPSRPASSPAHTVMGHNCTEGMWGCEIYLYSFMYVYMHLCVFGGFLYIFFDVCISKA